MADSYEFLKGHYDRIQAADKENRGGYQPPECGEDHEVGSQPNDCFACLATRHDELLAVLRAISVEARDVDGNGNVVIPSHVWDLVSAALVSAEGRCRGGDKCLLEDYPIHGGPNPEGQP